MENSIAHGILDREGAEGGLAHISARLEGSDLRNRISDNGAGIERAKLLGSRSHVQSHRIDSSSHRFGLRNIIDRLKVYSGSDYGFEIDSSVGRGTTVSIRIPAESRRLP